MSLGEKTVSQMRMKKRFLKQSITEICQQHLEEEFGADTASYLTNSLYWKKIEFTDKKGKKKKETKRDEAAAPALYAKLIYSDKSKKTLYSVPKETIK